MERIIHLFDDDLSKITKLTPNLKIEDITVDSFSREAVSKEDIETADRIIYFSDKFKGIRNKTLKSRY